jgi:hypothetical protein
MLCLDALLAAAELGAGAPFLEGVQDILHLFPPAFPFGFQGVLTGRFGGEKPPFRQALQDRP